MIKWYPGLTIEEMEKQAILGAMKYFHGNKTAVASALGISVRSVYDKLKKYDKANTVKCKEDDNGNKGAESGKSED